MNASNAPPSASSAVARAHGYLLAAAFALSVGCFVTSTLYTDAQLREIEPQSEAIAERAIPAIVHLSALRAALRDLDTDVEDEVAGHVGAVDRTDHAMRDAESAMNAYFALTRGSSQTARASDMPWGLERIQQGLRDVRARLAAGDTAGAHERFDAGMRFHIQQLDATLIPIIGVDAREARAAALDVARERRHARTVAFSLDAISLAATLAFGLLVFARIRRDERALGEAAIAGTPSHVT